MRVALPGPDNVGWITGEDCECESPAVAGLGFGGEGLLSFRRE